MIPADKYTKSVLTIIAAALVIIALRGSVPPAHADNSDDISAMASDISNLQSDVSDMKDDMAKIADGSCSNSKLC